MNCILRIGEGEATTKQAWEGPSDTSTLRLPGFLDNQHMKVVWLSVLSTGCLCPGIHFC